MCSNYIYVIGAMSGTSIDGLDLSLVKFDKNIHSNYKIINTYTYDYSNIWISKLKMETSNLYFLGFIIQKWLIINF